MFYYSVNIDGSSELHTTQFDLICQQVILNISYVFVIKNESSRPKIYKRLTK